MFGPLITLMLQFTTYTEPEERKRLGTDPMFKLQYQGKDEAVIEEAEPIIDKLQVWWLYHVFLAKDSHYIVI